MVSDIAQWISVGLIALGQIYILRRNRQNAVEAAIIAEKAASTVENTIKADIKSMRKALDSPTYGLSALEQRMRAYENTCASTRANLLARVDNLEEKTR